MTKVSSIVVTIASLFGLCLIVEVLCCKST
jgi:hypothetical protein